LAKAGFHGWAESCRNEKRHLGETNRLPLVPLVSMLAPKEFIEFY
jgi:hypothetical protein